MGLRNLAVVALPFVAMCDSRDLGGTVNSHNLGRPTLIVYDRYPGGLGYSEKGFARIERPAGDLPRDGRRLPVRVGLPELRGPAEPVAGDSQRSRSDARSADAGQSGDGAVVGAARRARRSGSFERRDDGIRRLAPGQ